MSPMRLHAGDALRCLVLQPAGVRRAGAARNDIKQPGVQLAVLISGQVDVSVTARSLSPIGDGREMCSSTPRTSTP
jgi:hypothetical protein